jgi:hypothetical protein
MDKFTVTLPKYQVQSSVYCLLLCFFAFLALRFLSVTVEKKAQDGFRLITFLNEINEPTNDPPAAPQRHTPAAPKRQVLESPKENQSDHKESSPLTQLLSDYAANKTQSRNQNEQAAMPLGLNPGSQGIGLNENKTTYPFGTGLKNRHLVVPAVLPGNVTEDGIVAVEIRVNAQGEVIFAKPLAKGSTTTSTALWDTAKQACLLARFDKSADSTEQKGVYYFRFSFKE